MYTINNILVINKVDIELTSNHLGYFEFRVCDLAANHLEEATADCLRKNLLRDPLGHNRFHVPSSMNGLKTYQLVLPKNMHCDHCVFQFK